MATDWLNISPAVNATAARAMQPHEIDTHFDGARIWATIIEARNDISKDAATKPGNYSDIVTALEAFEVDPTGANWVAFKKELATLEKL